MVKSAIYEDLDPADRAYGGFKKNNVHPAQVSFLRMNVDLYRFPDCILYLQQYRSMSKRNPFVRDVFTCPYQFKCGCYCALSVKTFSDKVEVALAGEHTASSHSSSSGILSVKQRGAVKRAVRSLPHSVGSQVQASLENFSPGKRVPFDRRSQKAVARLVRSERKEIMAERVPGIELDNTEGV